ncbi:beta-galactosidase [Gracilibacillus boraciitolerans JCM 21714]|uniref:Beta-galactosidase n=1 Tax=Gracilibacillus boraciitolerans JCM 21714 TaxID=1298598 RepID=W4VMS8_9BACI|nr:beta-galactosidase [Gracilibacillus boraciitolerans JCM 21714]
MTDNKQQAFTEAIYHLSKAIDSQRPIIVNDGWEHTVSDIISLHDYEEFADAFIARYQDKDRILNNLHPHNKSKYAFAQGYEYKGQPVILTEYGGIAFNDNRGWGGYGNQVNSEDEFIRRYREITNAIKEIPYICGYCYTQITDVQQEVNGLLYENREPKVHGKIKRSK